MVYMVRKIIIYLLLVGISSVCAQERKQTSSTQWGNPPHEDILALNVEIDVAKEITRLPSLPIPEKTIPVPVPSYIPIVPYQTNIYAHYDATGLVNNTTNTYGIVASNAISQLSDISGNGHHLTQSTGTKKPTLTTAAGNGMATASFDGGDHLANSTLADWKFLHDGSSYTIFLYVKAGTTSNPAAEYGIISTCDGSTQGINIYYGDVPGNNNDLIFSMRNATPATVVSTTGVSSSGIFIPNQYQLICVRVNTTTNNYIMSAMTSDGGIGAAKTAAAYSTSNPVNIFMLGAFSNGAGGGLPLVGEVQWCLIYNTALRTEDIGQVFYYAKVKFNL